ncbi:MAG: hypothetical protein LBS59_00180 [Puniceicoccales bacterium]|jgi:hypothetical protein|nr:hypothetical protein [Puniceicoccales bacterium]
MKHTRSFFLFFAVAALSGCGQPYDTDHYGNAVGVEPSHNFLGVVKTYPGSYRPVETVTVPLHSNEVSARRDFSGTNVSLFWGAITFADY